MNSFYTEEELKTLGLKSYGKKVLISKKVSIYSAGSISICNNVRIDDFCILSGEVTIGSHIHISAYCALYGAMGIELEDYTGISPRSTLFSAMDNFSGQYLIGPIHPEKYTNVVGGKIVIKRYAQIGAGTIIFPNLTIGVGVVVGSMSLVTKSLENWGVYAGIPAKYIKDREQGLLNFIDLK